MSLPDAPFPILQSVPAVRSWRAEQVQLLAEIANDGRSGSGSDSDSGTKVHKIGFVPTMGALHEGHLSLVQSSLNECDSTIVSIFVNPAQFAPHEDLATYPRTLESDIAKLASLSVTVPGTSRPRTVSALFLPPVEALYPSGITTDVSKQRGTFVEVKGLQEVMEGVSRPGFFRGVATVVIKLFNIVQPTRAYFGQKDIQQAILLRRMLTDLHVPAPLSRDLVIIPTHRDTTSGLALSSRNAYLTQAERPWATVLVDALRAGERVFKEMRTQADGQVSVARVLEAARQSVQDTARRANGSTSAGSSGSTAGSSNDVNIQLIYIAMNDPEELFDLELGQQQQQQHGGVVPVGKGAILSGAVMLGKTRLIDNMVFEYELN